MLKINIDSHDLNDTMTLMRRFPKTIARKSPTSLPSLIELEEVAYHYLTTSQIKLFNAVKDSNNDQILDMIHVGSISYDDLFCIDQSEMILLFDLLIQNCSLQVKEKIFGLVITPQCSGIFEQLIWAIRSHQSIDQVKILYNNVCQILKPEFIQLKFSRSNKYKSFYKNNKPFHDIDHLRTPLLEASLYDNYEVVSYLVSQGEDVNESDHLGRSPLFESCDWGHFNIVSFLLEHGATESINRPNQFNQYPLGVAIKCGNLDIAVKLIENSADITLINPDQQRQFLALQASTGKSIQLDVLLIMLETFLNKKSFIGGVFALQSLVKTLKSQKLADLYDLERFNPILSRKEFEIFYLLSKPYLEDIRNQDNNMFKKLSY